MGTAIAAAALENRIRVVICDADPAVRDRAIERVAAELGRDAGACRCEVTADYARIAECDLVLESIVEDAAAKQQVYSQLEPHLGAGA